MEVGQKAPEIVFFDTAKNKVTFKDYEGKNLVILFFPFAFSSVCTAELCEMRDNLTIYNSLNAEVVGISVDSLFTLARFKQEQNINFPLLSDFNKEASAAFGVLYNVFPAYDYKGVSKRAAFILDKEGVIRYAEVMETPKELPSFAEIKNTLSNLN